MSFLDNLFILSSHPLKIQGRHQPALYWSDIQIYYITVIYYGLIFGIPTCRYMNVFTSSVET